MTLQDRYDFSPPFTEVGVQGSESLNGLPRVHSSTKWQSWDPSICSYLLPSVGSVLMALGLGIVKSWDKELDMFPQRERKGGGLRFSRNADRWGLGGQGVINRNDELTPVIFASIPSFWE